jgi:hypothetical protein
MLRLAVIAMALGLPLSCASRMGGRSDIDGVAEVYVKLVLEVGLYDSDYVDAYFGPARWKPSEQAKEEPFPAERLGERASQLIEQLGKIEASGFTELERLRLAFLEKQLLAVRAKIDLLTGRKMSFDEESKALYDVVAPAYDEAQFQRIRKELEEVVPGEGDMVARLANYQARFTVPGDKLKEVLTTVTAEYRRRTAEHMTLPAGERFELRFVREKPWTAAATYKGGGFSLIEVNAEAPFGMANVVDLAGHEIYPGHHVHLSLLDRHLVKDRGWVEFSILPLHSPLALVSEGLAEYGRELALPRAERLEYERIVLFPLVGLDPSQVEQYHRIIDLAGKLEEAKAEAARRYLDGRMSRDEARLWLVRTCVMTPSTAENLMSFVDRYRTYLVSYSLGPHFIAKYIEQHGGTDADESRRWQLFFTLASTPRTPSGLSEAN